MQRVVELCIALLLAGCAAKSLGTAENLTSIPPNKGLVLFSTSADRTNSSFSTTLTLVEGASRNKYDKVYINIDHPSWSDFPGEHGHVRSLALPEGEYFLVPSPGKRTFYKFKVGNGRIAYIGNFHIANNSLHWSESKLRRDVEYFARKNPGLAHVAVEPQKAEFAGEASIFRINGTILTAP